MAGFKPGKIPELEPSGDDDDDGISVMRMDVPLDRQFQGAPRAAHIKKMYRNIPKASGSDWYHSTSTSPLRNEVVSGKTKAMVEGKYYERARNDPAPGTTFQGKPVGFNTGTKVVGKDFMKRQSPRHETLNKLQRDRDNEALGRGFRANLKKASD